MQTLTKSYLQENACVVKSVHLCCFISSYCLSICKNKEWCNRYWNFVWTNIVASLIGAIFISKNLNGRLPTVLTLASCRT